MATARRSTHKPIPQPTKLDVLVCATDEAVVVVEMDCQPLPAWVEGLKRRLHETGGLEDVAVKSEESTLYFLGFGRGSAALPFRVAKVLAEVGARAKPPSQSALVSTASITPGH